MRMFKEPMDMSVGYAIQWSSLNWSIKFVRTSTQDQNLVTVQ